MILYILILGALVCFRIQYAGRNHFYNDYMAKDKAQAIKGVFLFLVFSRHFSQYVTYASTLSQPFVSLNHYLGQLIVVPFLFYSGYGMAESIKGRGYHYIQRIPVRRFLNVLFQFDIAVLLFYFTQKALGNSYTWKQVFMSLICWDSLGNSNWYIFGILVLYFITWLVCVGLSENGKFEELNISGWLIAALSLCLVWILERHRPSYWYNTLLVFPSGYLYALYRERFEDFCFRSDRRYFLILGMLCILFYIFRKDWYNSLTAYEFTSVLFGLIVVLFVSKFRINSPLLQYCGEHLFSLYILQRLPMLILSATPVKNNIAVYLACSLVLTFVLGWIFDHTVPMIWEKIERKLVKA